MSEPTAKERYLKNLTSHIPLNQQGKKTMDNRNLIELKVKSFIEKDQMFTSVDISNAIKNDGIFIRNVTVADWLRSNCKDADLFSDYAVTSIKLDDGHRASLYHPTHLDAEDYKARGQKALTPVDVDKIKNKVVSKVFSSVPSKQKSKVSSKRKTTMSTNFSTVYRGNKVPSKGKVAKKTGHRAYNIQSIYGVNPKVVNGVEKYLIASEERIKIPGAIIRKLGWKPGDQIKTDKVVAKNAKLPDRLVVNADHRVSIPRSCVPWGKAPVNVFLEDNVVCFEKA